MHRCNCHEQFHNQVDLASCDISEHLLDCANRTVKCPICQKYIRQAILNYHCYNNCIDLDEGENISIAAGNKNSELASQLLLNDNNAQVNDLIPCDLCGTQIEFSLYELHTKICILEQTLHITNSAPSIALQHSRINKISDSTKPTEEQTDTKLINTSTSDKSLSKESAVSLLHEKTINVQSILHKNYFSNEVNYATDKLQFNIVLAGSPRVGKSQLINALCGKPLAETSASLNSCTKEVKCYTLEDDQQRPPGVKPCRINFYDTPGIESWTDENGKTTMLKFIEEKDPICLIYCASPGSFTKLDQVRPVLEHCNENGIFCALVCTNMWSDGTKRKTVIEEFEKQLEIFGKPEEKLVKEENNQVGHKVTVFGNGALCTMVNSIEYHDEDLSPEKKPVQGIDELIYCIMEALDQEKLLGWYNAVLYRRSFWEKFGQKVDGFFSPIFNKIFHR